MFAVIIHWMIKPDDESKAKFFEFWRTRATINDDNELIGEFLSAPMPASQLPFRIDEVFPVQDKPYVSFVNIGLWKNYESFFAQVGRHFNDEKPPLEFEQYRRRRIPLSPMYWRRGKCELPTENNV